MKERLMKIDISTDAYPGTFTLIDERDAYLFERHKWTPDASGYVHRKSASGGKLYLHRVIAGATDGEVVDHINRDRRDNRRSNLRLVSRSDNNRNRTGWGSSSYRGVHIKRDRWHAEIKANGRSWSLGSFDTAEDAAAAYDNALAFFGMTSVGLNLPERTPTPVEPTTRKIGPHGYPGVRRLPSGRFGARVIRNGRRFSIGVFDSAEEASRAAQQEANDG